MKFKLWVIDNYGDAVYDSLPFSPKLEKQLYYEFKGESSDY